MQPFPCRHLPTMSIPPNILECEASELAEYLLSNRFEMSSKATATFLLQATSSLPNAEELSAEFLREEEEQEDQVVNLGEALSDPTEVSMIIPRGKMTCTLFEQGIYCCNAKNETFKLLPNNAGKLVVFPKPEDIKKRGTRHMILLTLEQKVMFKNKELSQICFQLPQDPLFLDSFRAALDLTDMAQVGQGWTFKSHIESSTSTTTGGLPCVRCYHGVNDGHLFPLEQGILFFKPPLFLHRSSLHSIACGRGASGSSRYVDMNIQLEDKSTLEFTNIHREELGGLNAYLHKVLIPAMKQDAVAENDDKNGTEPDDNDDDDDDGDVVEAEELDDESKDGEATDDDDYDDDGHDDEDGDDDDDDDDDDDTSGAAHRSNRKTSKEARQTTKTRMTTDLGDDDDDEEDDDDWDSSGQQDDDDDDDGNSVNEDGEVFFSEDGDESDGEQKARPPKKQRRR